MCLCQLPSVVFRHGSLSWLGQQSDGVAGGPFRSQGDLEESVAGGSGAFKRRAQCLRWRADHGEVTGKQKSHRKTLDPVPTPFPFP